MENCEACGTPEQAEKLKAVIEESKSTPGCLMHILQEAQGIYGFLPMSVQKTIAEGLGISLSEVYGVVTFYSQFSLKPKGKHRISVCLGTPKGKHRISVCLGTACYVKGSDKILSEIEKELGIACGECTEDGLFSIDSCRCVGACGLAPVMMIGDEVYGKLTPESVKGILDKYRKEENA